jgi:hypothetical protein
VGEINVSLNQDIVSSGQIFAASAPGGPKACRIATAAVFDIPQLGVTVSNREPILLMNENVRSFPPVNDPSGQARIFRLPLFDHRNPSSQPFAYLTSLRYGAEDYITESEALAFRAQGR